MSAIPTRIPIIQIFNFVILNKVVLFFHEAKAAITPPKIAHNTPPIAIITCGFSVDSNANIGDEAMDGNNPTIVVITSIYHQRINVRFNIISAAV
jgi:hypothetical protein